MLILLMLLSLGQHCRRLQQCYIEWRDFTELMHNNVCAVSMYVKLYTILYIEVCSLPETQVAPFKKTQCGVIPALHSAVKLEPYRCASMHMHKSSLLRACIYCTTRV